MPHGFVYLFAVIDWYSRFILAWELSPTLDTALLLGRIGELAYGKPEIFHIPDQGRLYQPGFHARVLGVGAALSMDVEAVALVTTFLSNAFGGRSNTKTSI